MMKPEAWTKVRVKAWVGDVEQRLGSRLARLGFATATEYARTRPGESLIALAAELGPGDVAAVQLERRLYEEAIASGTVEAFARDLLVRSMREHIPEGWRRDWGPDVPGDTTTARWRASRACAGWAAAIDYVSTYEAAAGRVMLALRDAAPFPDGWLPLDADDRYLVEFFANYWRT